MTDKIDPKHITNYERTPAELQRFWIYCIVVAGRNSDQASRTVGNLFKKLSPEQLPFEFFRGFGNNSLHNYLVAHKVGQYGRIEKAITQSLGLDLRTCTLGDLMAIHGVGPKTARFFLLHTRREARYAVLDTHILKWLRSKDVADVPASTPTKASEYVRLEDACLSLIESEFPGVALADADLLLWTQLSGRLEADLQEPESAP